MNHEQRISLAIRITNQRLAILKENIVLVLLAGSTARSEDLEYSDLELILVTKESIESTLMLAEGIVVELISITQSDLAKIVSDPSQDNWFFWAGVLSTAKVLSGDPNMLDNFREASENIPLERYSTASKRRLIWMLEHLGHVRNSVLRGDSYAAIFNALWLTDRAGEFVALVNHSFYTKMVARSLDEIKKFRLIPKDYLALMQDIYIEKDLNRITEMAQKLCTNCFGLASENDISLENYKLL